MHGRNPLVIHYVRDMDRAKMFYREVLDVVVSFESLGWTTFDLGAIELALHSSTRNRTNRKARCRTPGSILRSTTSRTCSATSNGSADA